MKTRNFVLWMIIAASVALANDSLAQKENISISHLHKDYKFIPQKPDNMKMSTDGEHYTSIVDQKKIIQYSIKTGKELSTLIDLNTIENCPIDHIAGYEISPLGTHILLYSNVETIYRHSFTANYYLYDLRYKSFNKLSDKEYERDAIFSPNGAMIAYIYDNNIYLKKLRYDSTSAITTDGKENEIINGAADWVYEEEFTLKKAMAWSHDSKEIAYLQFDETEVNFHNIAFFNEANTPSDNMSNHLEYLSYKYPHAGETNSTVRVKVFNIENRTTKTMQTGEGTDYYIPRISWTGVDKELAILKLNRRQNQLDILIGNSASTVCNTIFSDREERYVEESVLDNFLFLPDGQHFLYTGELDGYRHIYLYAKNGVQIAQLTNGNYDVTALLGYDQKTKKVFFQAAKESPTEREIYSISTDKKILTKLSKQRGINNATFNNSCTYYINNYSSADTPPVYTVCNALGQTIRTIVDNNTLRNQLTNYNIHKKEFFTLNASDGTPLNGWMVRPHNWNSGDKYPVLIVQYNGPNHQEVLNSWDLDWEQTLAADGYIVACVDTRGTGARGEEFRKCTYQHLGRQESNDMIDVAKWLGEQTYVDATRIGIWGWSYGGYMVSLCMSKCQLFKVGISVAGVSNWKYYDTVYSERHMRKPEENISGYNTENPLVLAGNLSGKLFLIHGAADDNVLIQNHMDYVTKLIEHDKQFDTFVYPNKNHSIYGGNTRNHLYTMMYNYIKNNL